MEICARVYRPRRARESPLFRLVEQHLEDFLGVYPARFAKAHGPLRAVVERVLRGFMRCDGAFSDDGEFHPLETWDADAVMKLFRERLLARLTLRHAISEELVRKLLAWRHPGFSAHVGEAIPFEHKKAVEDVACYMVRAPLSLKKLVYLDGQKAVLYRSKMNPSLGRKFEAMDPLEWLARMADHIPDTGKHRTHFYGFYASRVRASRRETEGSELKLEAAPTKRRCPPSWARLISKVYQANPLVCKGCGGPLVNGSREPRNPDVRSPD